MMLERVLYRQHTLAVSLLKRLMVGGWKIFFKWDYRVGSADVAGALEWRRGLPNSPGARGERNYKNEGGDKRKSMIC
jgi:hypothetical protein